MSQSASTITQNLFIAPASSREPAGTVVALVATAADEPRRGVVRTVFGSRNAARVVTVDQDIQFFRSFPSERWVPAMPAVGVQWTQPAPSTAAVVGRLSELFGDVEIESGTTHPAEAVLEHLIRSAPSVVAEAVSAIAHSDAHVGPQLVQCVGRLGSARAKAALMPVVAECLKSPHIRMRDAAVRAAESWAGPEAVQLLDAHEEPVAWLRDYVDQVLRDLKR